MRAIPWIVFTILVITSAALIAASAGALPESVAVHFASGGRANGWMTRDGYLEFTLLIAVVLPVIIVAGVGVLPRLAWKRINIPNRDYWLADARRDETLSTLSSYGCVLGCLTTLFVAGIHYTILAANATTPPQLPEAHFIALVVAFVAATALWMVMLYVRFRSAR